MSHFILIFPVLLFSFVAHEYAHVWAALKQGDDTGYMLGRLTLNPLPHLDPFMSIIVPIGLYVMTNGAFTFGGPKPAPVTPRNFRNYRRGDLVVSSAGVIMNLILALVCAGVFVLIGFVGRATFFVPGFWNVLLWPVGMVATTVQSAIGAYSLPIVP